MGLSAECGSKKRRKSADLTLTFRDCTLQQVKHYVGLDSVQADSRESFRQHIYSNSLQVLREISCKKPNKLPFDPEAASAGYIWYVSRVVDHYHDKVEENLLFGVKLNSNLAGLLEPSESVSSRELARNAGLYKTDLATGNRVWLQETLKSYWLVEGPLLEPGGLKAGKNRYQTFFAVTYHDPRSDFRSDPFVVFKIAGHSVAMNEEQEEFAWQRSLLEQFFGRVRFEKEGSFDLWEEFGIMGLSIGRNSECELYGPEADAVTAFGEDSESDLLSTLKLSKVSPSDKGTSVTGIHPFVGGHVMISLPGQSKILPGDLGRACFNTPEREAGIEESIELMHPDPLNNHGHSRPHGSSDFRSIKNTPGQENTCFLTAGNEDDLALALDEPCEKPVRFISLTADISLKRGSFFALRETDNELVLDGLGHVVSVRSGSGVFSMENSRARFQNLTLKFDGLSRATPGPGTFRIRNSYAEFSEITVSGQEQHSPGFQQVFVEAESSLISMSNMTLHRAGLSPARAVNSQVWIRECSFTQVNPVLLTDSDVFIVASKWDNSKHVCMIMNDPQKSSLSRVFHHSSKFNNIFHSTVDS